MPEVIGKNCPVRTAALEMHEQRVGFFWCRNFPGSISDLPEDGDLVWVVIATDLKDPPNDFAVRAFTLVSTFPIPPPVACPD